MSAALYFTDAGAFRAWLACHAASATELLVGYHKVLSGKPCMSWSDSVDVALCYGWIDGVRRRVDDQRYTIRFTPRKASSIWSTVNIGKVDKLRAQGRMTAAGEQAYALRSAARSGVYSHEQLETAQLSLAELQVFQASGAAWAFFEGTPPGYRKRMLHWVTSAKCVFHANWTPVPPQTGHPFQTKLVTYSRPNWTPWAQRRGVEVWFYSGRGELVKLARFFRSESPFKLSW